MVNWKDLARANGTSRRTSGWAGENAVRSWDHPSHPLKLIARCGLARGTARLGRRGGVGEKSDLFSILRETILVPSVWAPTFTVPKWFSQSVSG